VREARIEGLAIHPSPRYATDYGRYSGSR